MIPLVLALTLNCLVPPVGEPIVAGFVAPECAFCASHRTIDFAGSTGRVVVAPAAGRVTFAGLVAERPFVTIALGPEEQVSPWPVITVGGLSIDPGLATGDMVRSGQRLGLTNGVVTLSMRYIAAGSAASYRDPAPFLERRRTRVRLVPTDGSRRRRASVTKSCARPLSVARASES